MVSYNRKKSIAKRKAKRRTGIKVATGRKISATKRMAKFKKGKLKKAQRGVEAVGMVISPRERKMEKGIISPFERPPEEMPQSVQDYFLTSRAIRHMAYNARRNILEITFQTGHVYQFWGVPQAVWESFKMAQSKGRFFMNEIYGYWAGPKGEMTYFPNYTYARVR